MEEHIVFCATAAGAVFFWKQRNLLLCELRHHRKLAKRNSYAYIGVFLFTSYIEMCLYRSHLHMMKPGGRAQGEHLFGPQTSAMKGPQLLPVNLQNRLSFPTSSRSSCFSPLFTPALPCHPNYLHGEVEASHLGTPNIAQIE